jgi:phosphohistidine phosphatase
MKNLILLRHATAEEGSQVFKDIERELTSRGIMEAARIGNYLKSAFKIDAIYTSPSFRTMKTSELVADQLKIEIEDIIVNESLYGGGPRAYLSILNNLPEDQQTILLVGHNPDITFFAEYLCHDDIGGGMAKATAIQISFEANTWAELTQKSGKFISRKDVEEIDN